MSRLSKEDYLALKERLEIVFNGPVEIPDHVDPQYVDAWMELYRSIPSMVLSVYGGMLPNPAGVWQEFWSALGEEGRVAWRENWERAFPESPRSWG